MSYDVSFKAKLEGADQWVYVGDDWINHTSNTAAMIKEVCGSYPSEWNGKRCADMYPVLMQGASLLCLHPKRYRQFEPGNCWSSMTSTMPTAICPCRTALTKRSTWVTLAGMSGPFPCVKCP